MNLSEQQVLGLASLPLKNIEQEYPNHIMHHLNSAADVLSPKQMHPIFYGSFDWHSAVHGYWLLLAALEQFPNLESKAEIERIFNQHFSVENVATELAYFNAPGRVSYERPYGYGWILALDQKLYSSTMANARQLWENLQPLTLKIRALFIAYLDKLTYSIRVGTHYNTAFSMSLALDYARAFNDQAFEQVLVTKAKTYFTADKAYPFHYEPNGDDYLSGGLTEALLMSQCLDSSDFTRWYKDFVANDALLPALKPAVVSDPTDPKVSHLEGLNLSRAWCLRKVAKAINDDKAQKDLAALAQAHLHASIDNVINSHYSGSHWLGTFAFLAISA